MRFHPHRPHQLLTSSYDGTVRCADFERDVFDEVYATPDEDDIRLSSFDFLSESSIVAGQGDGMVAVCDLRTESPSAENLYYAHRRYIKCISVHPTQREYFAT